jgi:hypothetical protein
MGREMEMGRAMEMRREMETGSEMEMGREMELGREMEMRREMEMGSEMRWKLGGRWKCEGDGNVDCFGNGKGSTNVLHEQLKFKIACISAALPKRSVQQTLLSFHHRTKHTTLPISFLLSWAWCQTIFMNIEKLARIYTIYLLKLMGPIKNIHLVRVSLPPASLTSQKEVGTKGLDQ